MIIRLNIYGQNDNTNDKSRDSKIKITITIGDKVLTAMLNDNPTTRDFISLLPLTLTLDDYAGTEKVIKLSKKLSVKNSPSGSDPSVGDIAYYSPWGNLAFFYNDFGYSNGLIILGKIDSDMEVFKKHSGTVKVRIDLIN